MEIKQTKLIYFSPTGTTRNVLEGVAQGIGVEHAEHVDLTLVKETPRSAPPCPDELVLIGAPVYAGRLPVDAVKRFKQLEANATPAVLIVVYGNREFEDALMELKQLALELGFRPVAGAAFIGEHSFATDALPIANGRPDDRDIQAAVDFGRQVRGKITALESPDALTDLEVPGHFPYKADGVPKIHCAPVTHEEKCTQCGTCEAVCPTAAVFMDAGIATHTERCIKCCACIKNCPENARTMEDDTVKNIAGWLNENFSARKEPEIFGVDAF